MIRTLALFALAAAAAFSQTTPATPAKSTSTPPRKPSATAASATLPTYKELKFPELRPIVFPKVETVTLPNGIRLCLLEDHEVPLVSGTMLVGAGSLFDPPDKIGLASLAVQVLLDGGIASRPGDALLRRFQDLGANVETSVTENTLTLSFTALKDTTDEVLDMLKDAILAPEFQQERLDFAKARMRNAIAHRNDDAATILEREFQRIVYGTSSPYAAQVEYTNLDRINRGDLVNFHRRYFFPKNVMISLQGDFDAAAMKARIEALFVDWKVDQPPVPEFPKVNPEGAPGRYLAKKTDAPQGYFIVGQLGGELSDKDYPALQILSDILGSAPRGRINQKIHAFANSLSVSWGTAFDHPGLFEVRGEINPFRTAQVLQMVYDELKTIRATEVTEEELKAAKDTTLNSLVFAFDSQSVMARLTQFEYFHIPKDFVERYQSALAAVTRADVLRVARERLDPARMTTLVVANPLSFETALESLGSAVNPVELTIPPPKTEALLGDPASQRRGKELLIRAQQAMGGSDKLAGVTDYVEEDLYQLEPSAGGTQSTMIERWLAPTYLRQDNSLPQGKVSVYCDGKTGWVASAGNSNALTGVQLKQVQGDLYRTLFPLLLSDRTPSRKVNAVDDNTVEVSETGGEIVKLVFDSATGLLKNVLYDTMTTSGQVSVINTYSDYREISGIKLPFKASVAAAGQKVEEVTTKSIRINTGLKLQELERRP